MLHAFHDIGIQTAGDHNAGARAAHTAKLNVEHLVKGLPAPENLIGQLFLQQAQELIAEECPLVFMISQELLGASTSKVKGFKLYPNMISPLYAVTIAE